MKYEIETYETVLLQRSYLVEAENQAQAELEVRKSKSFMTNEAEVTTHKVEIISTKEANCV